MSSIKTTAEVLVGGALTTVQDAGRTGYAALGWPECGAADKYSMRLANILAGNGLKSNASVLECTLTGVTLRFGAPAVVAAAGAAFSPVLDDVPVPMFCPVAVKAGQVLAMGTAQSGLRGYLAVHGGWDVPEVMHSRSTDLKCGIGGYKGRALRRGDTLAVCAPPAGAEAGPGRRATVPPEMRAPLARWRVQGAGRWPVLRCVLGPQDEAFTAKGRADFVRGVYTLTADCNRMACKLAGTPIESVGGSDIISDGIVEGSVQIAADGQPIVMLADHQTTGGYAKIATVIPCDCAVLAQLRPGEKVGFCYVAPEQAVSLTRSEYSRLEWLEGQL